MNRALTLLLLLPGLTILAPAYAASLEPQNYRRAFAALDAGHADLAYGIVAHAHDPVLNKVLRSYYMAAPGNEAGFAEMAAFIHDNPDWPNLKDIRAIAEQKIPAGATPEQVVGWFAAYPPASLAGVYRYADALNASGRMNVASILVRQRWIQGEFRESELTAFYARFGVYLRPEDHLARLDRLLWNNDANGAQRLYGLVDGGTRAVAEARLALAAEKGNVAALYTRVPEENRNNPGLLFEELRWFRRANRDADALKILQHEPDNPGRPEMWWDERQYIIRRAIDRRDYNLAYRLAADHHLTDGRDLLQAEFLAGWLALRFLNEPDDAREHFETLYGHATTPISRARGAYWLGRALEALDEKSDAEQAYETASALNITYYGQLATTRLYAKPVIAAKPEPAIPMRVREAFFARDAVRAVERLHDLGETARAHTFFKSIVDTSNKRADFVLLSELAYQIKRPDYAIEAAKAANQKNMLVAAGGFPLFDRHIPDPPEPALIQALIRQESMFNPDAAMNLQKAGWSGVSQLMLGVFITLGCSVFAAADFAKGQKTADIFTKIAPAILTCATAANIALVLTTWNPFILLSLMAFAVSNLAGFFTKIEKKEPISAGI